MNTRKFVNVRLKKWELEILFNWYIQLERQKKNQHEDDELFGIVCKNYDLFRTKEELEEDDE